MAVYTTCAAVQVRSATLGPIVGMIMLSRGKLPKRQSLGEPLARSFGLARFTPAYALGVTGRVWEIENLVPLD